MKICNDVYLIASGSLGFDWTHPADCNVYAVDTGQGLVLIDAGTGLSINEMEANLVSYGFRMQQVAYVLLTHLHADHSGGAAEWRRRTGAKIAALDLSSPILEQGDEEAIELPRAKQAGLYPLEYIWESCRVDKPLRDGDTFETGKYTVTVFHTPGHSAYDTCYLFEGESGPMLFSGDTVMYGGKISMLNTKDFSLQQLAASIERLARLKPKMLLPGHGQPALDRAGMHLNKAIRVFNNLGVPENIG